MRINRATSIITMLVLALMVALPIHSQEKKSEEEDPIKLNAELVQIDAIVTDKNNKPVSGLKAEDFVLYDNDKPQKISFFSYEEARARRIEELRDRSLPRMITPGELKRVIAFVVDTVHMKPENVYRTRQMLDDFVQTKMEPGDLVLVMPTGGGSGLYQQFTSDQRVLRRAISRLRPAFILDSDTPARRGGSSSEVLALLPALAEARANVPQAEGQGGLNAGINTGEVLEEADVRTTIAALESVIKAVSRLPGRKINVFISEGFRTFRTRQTNILSDTTHLAARANVVFYTIDPGGLEPLGYTAADSRGIDTSRPVPTDPLSPSGLAVQPTARLDTNADEVNPTASIGDRRADYYESQESLSMLALETGGKFFRNSNDIKMGLSNLLEENSAYYLLGFQPEQGKWDGKYHKIKIEVRGRPDLVVSTRKGYLARNEKPRGREAANPKVAEALEAISSPLIRRDIDLQLTPFYRDDTKREPVMTSLLHIDASKLNFRQDGGKYKTKLDITGFVMDAAGRTIDGFNNTTALELEPKVYQEIVKQGLLWTRAISVKPGAYQLKMLVREGESGFIGTANSYIEVPMLKGDELALSSIFMDAGLLQQDKSSSGVSGGSTLAQRRFSRNGQFAYVVIVYNAKSEGKQTGLEISTRILRNGQVVFAGQPKPVDVLEGSTPPARIITGGIMSLGQLAPDDYTLEVTIVDKLRKKDKSNIVRQEIDFSVE